MKKFKNISKSSITTRYIKKTILLGFLCIAGWVIICFFTLPDISQLGNKERKPSISVTDKNNVIIGSYGDVYGGITNIDDVPKFLIDSIMIIEDRRFYNHLGVDFIGLLRALIKNMQKGYVVQGASTITQQLAKMVFLNPERTYTRKIKELLISFWLENKFSKNQILTMYINRVYLGSGLYGISSASMRYFSKKPSQLNLSESAIIAGLLKAPSRLSPINNAAASSKRGKLIVKLLLKHNKITILEAKNSLNNLEILGNKKYQNINTSGYYMDWIISQSPIGINRDTADIFVKSTLDINLQKIAVQSVINNLQTVDDNVQAAVVVLDYNGAVKAMVGGKNWSKSQFNRATSAKRQPGSIFKTFIYLAAIESGYSSNDKIDDSQLNINGWIPRNGNNKYLGLITLKEAFARSSNVAAVRLSEEIGRKQVIKEARRLGIISYIPDKPSMALGTASLNLLELTGAFVAIGGEGTPVIPYGIDNISLRDQKTNLWSRQNPDREPIIKKEV